MFKRRGEDPKYDAEMTQAYNDLFTSKIGPKVLNHMLWELYFYHYTIPGAIELTETHRVLQDYAKRLLMWIGVWDEKNDEEIVEKMLKLKPIINKPEDKEEDENAL
jgi:hypothetical protein